MDTTDTHLGFTVSPEKLSLDPNTLVRNASLIALQESYISKNSFNKIYFEHSNCPEAIIAFCESIAIPKYRQRYKSTHFLFLTDKDVFLALLPPEIQLKILSYCNLYPDELYNPYFFNRDPFAFNFVGFLNEESVYGVKHKVFHFTEFDIQPQSEEWTQNLEIIFKDKELGINVLTKDTAETLATKICTTLKTNRLMHENVNYWKSSLLESLNKNLKKRIIPFQIHCEFLCFPFTLTPLMHQQVKYYFRHSNFVNTINIQNKDITFSDCVTSCFFLQLNSDTYLIIAELISLLEKKDNIVTKIPRLYDAWNTNTNNFFLENHRIEIYEYHKDKMEYSADSAIQIIPLPFFNVKNNLNKTSISYDSAKSYIRFTVHNIFRNALFIYDKQYNLYACFSLTDNKYILYENQSNHNHNLRTMAALILLSFLCSNKETIIKKIEETKIKNENWDNYSYKSNKPKRPDITEKIAKSIAPTIIIILSLYKIYRARHLLYNDLKSILNYILAPLYKTMHYQKL